MIQRGHQKPTRAQLAEVRKRADDSFCTVCTDEFGAAFPNAGFKPAQLPILLKCKTVEEHDDPWVGNSRLEPSMKDRRAIFWLMDTKQPFTLRCGEAAVDVEMAPGDYVVFNDAHPHAVLTDGLWRGSTVQVFSGSPGSPTSTRLKR